MRISDWSSDVCSSDLVQHVGAGTALKAAFQVAAPLRAGGQNAGAEQGGRHRQSDAEGRRAAEEFTPAEAPEGRLPAEVLQVAVHDLCLSVRLSFAVQPAAVPTGLVSQSRSADTDPRRRRSVTPTPRWARDRKSTRLNSSH